MDGDLVFHAPPGSEELSVLGVGLSEVDAVLGGLSKGEGRVSWWPPSDAQGGFSQ